jgi:CxxC-x17-CxxC domain-containing protein
LTLFSDDKGAIPDCLTYNYTEENTHMGFNDRPRSGGFGRSFNDGPREMHKAVCSECKKECEVPFKPTEGKPVYCRECYASKKPARRF